MKKAIIVILIGVALVAGVIATGSKGISDDNIAVYEKAVSLESENSFGFSGFALSDYPVAFYDGDRNYVFEWKNGEYEITKRAAVLNFIVATAYPVEGHYEVLTPTVEKMSSLLSLMGHEKNNYGAEEHISTLWHEAFHCFQLTNYKGNIEDICAEADESLIAEYADKNEAAVKLFKQKAQLLKKAVMSNDIDKIREYIVQYKKLNEERKALLSDEVNDLEEYYTRIEGSACYVEACVYKMQLPESFESSYIEAISDYGGGSAKYYKSGMAMCMILDTIAPEWKQNYDFSVPLTDLIYAELEI